MKRIMAAISFALLLAAAVAPAALAGGKVFGP